MSAVRRLHTRWDLKKVTPCEYVVEGEHVAAAWLDKARLGQVVTACGESALVRFRDGSERWYHVSDLARKKEDR